MNDYFCYVKDNFFFFLVIKKTMNKASIKVEEQNKRMRIRQFFVC